MRLYTWCVLLCDAMTVRYAACHAVTSGVIHRMYCCLCCATAYSGYGSAVHIRAYQRMVVHVHYPPTIGSAYTYAMPTATTIPLPRPIIVYALTLALAHFQLVSAFFYRFLCSILH